MKFQEEQIGELILVKYSGALTLENQASFLKYFTELLPKPFKYIAFDFEFLDTIDSMGIGMLVKCVRECHQKKKELVIFGLRKEIRETFQQATLINFFNIMSKEGFKKKYLDKIEFDEMSKDF